MNMQGVFSYTNESFGSRLLQREADPKRDQPSTIGSRADHQIIDRQVLKIIWSLRSPGIFEGDCWGQAKFHFSHAFRKSQKSYMRNLLWTWSDRLRWCEIFCAQQKEGG